MLDIDPDLTPSERKSHLLHLCEKHVDAIESLIHVLEKQFETVYDDNEVAMNLSKSVTGQMADTLFTLQFIISVLKK